VLDYSTRKYKLPLTAGPLFSQIDMLNIFDWAIQETLSQPLEFFYRVRGEECQGR